MFPGGLKSKDERAEGNEFAAEGHFPQLRGRHSEVCTEGMLVMRSLGIRSILRSLNWDSTVKTEK